MTISFKLLKTSSTSAARRGVLYTAHGVVQTPVFMPVGTLGQVKSLDSADMHNLGAGMMLSNAYHLMLRPGAELIAQMGGLHRFNGYDGAILTDSGGFQVFSLAKMRQITDRGVIFRSHIDGHEIDLTPEHLVHIQECIGPDVAMVLDECPHANAPRDVVEAAIARTTQWAHRAIAARARPDMAWFGIVQGALFDDLRAQHAQALSTLPFDGFAIGGVSVGEAAHEIDRVVRHTAPLLPADKPRYLMGVGTPDDIVRGVAAGIDMFDCVMPSRNARNGQLFTSRGKVNIKNAIYRDCHQPIDSTCHCSTCERFSCAYLRHLFIAGEVTYFRLATIHNIAFYLNLMNRIRMALDNDTFVAENFLSIAQ